MDQLRIRVRDACGKARSYGWMAFRLSELPDKLTDLLALYPDFLSNGSHSSLRFIDSVVAFIEDEHVEILAHLLAFLQRPTLDIEDGVPDDVLGSIVTLRDRIAEISQRGKYLEEAKSRMR